MIFFGEWMTEKITIDLFGKDHWSLFAYCETRAVDYKGVLALEHMTVKNPAIRGGWKPEYGTRLKGYWKEDGTTDETLKLQDHDDLDCLDELEEAGLIKNIGSGLNPAVKLTDLGKKVASDLREHKANGGMFANFVFLK